MNGFESDEVVNATSQVTLHYRLTLEGGKEIAGTFGMGPALIQMGAGQLSANLERCLIGLKPGDERHWRLEPDAAFGGTNPALIQKIDRSVLPSSISLVVGEPLEGVSETGIPYAGVVREVDDETVTVDFNHPLAGRSVLFDVLIVGTMS